MEGERIARFQLRNKSPDVISKKRKASNSSPKSSLEERRQPKFSRQGAIHREENKESHQDQLMDHNSACEGIDHALENVSRVAAELTSNTDLKPSIEIGKFPQETKLRGDVSGTGIQFPFGVVKKTWAFGFPRMDDIKIEEVLQRSTLEHAVLGAFQIEPDWVISKIKPTTKVIWVLQAKTEAEVSRLS